MAEKAIGNIIWEDNPDTPIDASGLSSSFDYQSQSKFLYYTNTDDDYVEWADYVINYPTWPLEGDVGWDDDFIGSVVYNKGTQEAQTAFYGGGGAAEWDELASPYRKILKILAETKITSSYLRSSDDEIQYESFYFEEDQIFSVDDLLEEDDLSPDSFYSVVLYHHYTYGDQAAIKLVNSIYDDVVDDSSWKKDGVNTISPSGYNVVSYRKIGSFQTNSGGYIEEETLWDLSTYRTELTIEKLKIDTGGIVEDHEAKHVPIQSVVGDVQFNANNVQDALIETREVLNNLSGSFYTNRRGGLEPRYAFGRKVTPTAPLIALSNNEIALVLTAGFIDVSGSESTYENDIFFANNDVPLNINDGIWATERTLGARQLDQQGNDTKIYEGIWRLFIDELGRILVKEQNESGGVPVWHAANSGWYDSVNGTRCIGKFSVSNSGSIYYIDKMSITGTLDFDPPPGTLFHFHGTMCPDGLIPCDGLWHDVTGRDTNSYTILNLPDIAIWGQSWYEEAPLLMGKTLKMSDTPTISNSGGKFDISIGSGGSDDAGLTGGSDDHDHMFEHDHGTGTINIIASGEHDHNADYIVDAPTSGETVQVDTVPSGTYVATGGHIHNLTNTSSGEHLHSSQEILGRTETIDGSSAETDLSSSWSPYKEVLICIKK